MTGRAFPTFRPDSRGFVVASDHPAKNPEAPPLTGYWQGPTAMPFIGWDQIDGGSLVAVFPTVSRARAEMRRYGLHTRARACRVLSVQDAIRESIARNDAAVERISAGTREDRAEIVERIQERTEKMRGWLR